MTQYQPKGGMCMTCAHRFRNCSGLDFSQMRVIKKYPDGTMVVKCNDYYQGAPAGYQPGGGAL